MFNLNFSPKSFLFVFLLFCVCSSKSIIIYNEETLVAISFCLFVIFVFHYFGNTVKESLDERSENIKIECQDFLHYKEQSLQQLFAEHQKIGQLENAASQLMRFTKEQIQGCTATSAHSLEKTFSQQIIQKCNELRVSQLPQKLQGLIASLQQKLVLTYCGKAQSNHLSAAVLKNAIQLLTSTVKKNNIR